VKTLTFNLRVEILSGFRRCENQLYWQPLSEEGNWENNSTHPWLIRVFTQPRPIGDLPRCPLSRRYQGHSGHQTHL